MKKIILFVALMGCVGIMGNAWAQESADSLVALQEKQAEIEAKLSAREKQTLARIDARIEKAKAAGKPTDKLERRREDLLKRIAEKEEHLNAKVNAKKAKLQ